MCHGFSLLLFRYNPIQPVICIRKNLICANIVSCLTNSRSTNETTNIRYDQGFVRLIVVSLCVAKALLKWLQFLFSAKGLIRMAQWACCTVKITDKHFIRWASPKQMSLQCNFNQIHKHAFSWLFPAIQTKKPNDGNMRI